MNDLQLLNESLIEPRLLNTARHMVGAIAASNTADVDLEMHDMSVEDLVALGTAFVNTTKMSTVLVGKVAYEIRARTPDGGWGQEVYRLATEWDVSERTIHRWMKSAQEAFGFELTPAQKNSAVSSPPTQRQVEGRPEGDDGGWGDELDDEDPFAGLGLEADDPELESLENMQRLQELIGEPWAERDSVTPSPEYRNAPEGGGAPGRAPALPPDPTWVGFTAGQIMAEHPEMPETSAQRSAVARWSRKVEDEPLDLLEELEMIYESSGETLPETTVQSLYDAEDNKALKPEVVPEGEKKKRAPSGPKPVDGVAEKLMTSARELHQRIHAGLKDGTVQDREIAAMSTHLSGLAYTVDGLKKMAQEAKARAAGSGDTAADRIAATLEAEAEGEGPGF